MSTKLGGDGKLVILKSSKYSTVVCGYKLVRSTVKTYSFWNENETIFTVNIEHFDAGSEYEYKWTKDNNDLDWSEESYTIEAADNEEPGTYIYKCEVTRTYAGVQSSSYKEFTYTVKEKIEEPE